MSDLRVGVNLPGGSTDPRRLDEWLRSFEEDGFDCVEISLDTFPFIIGGAVSREWVDVVKGVLAKHRLARSAHVSLGVDLRDTATYDFQKRVLSASIEVAAALGANPLVLHYERQSRDTLVEERFRSGHREAADAASRLGLTLCIENIEVERVEPVVQLVREVDRPNFRLTFDTGHAFLAARYFHFDFLDALRMSLPFLGHLHLNDNTGDFEELRITDRVRYDTLAMGYRRTFGRGDIHLPPFWGAIPFAQMFALLSDYRGMFVCEYTAQDFVPFNRAVQEKVRAAITTARRRGGP
jgi:sugar phosphate isomerase/epimerase